MDEKEKYWEPAPELRFYLDERVPEGEVWVGPVERIPFKLAVRKYEKKQAVDAAEQIIRDAREQ